MAMARIGSMRAREVKRVEKRDRERKRVTERGWDQVEERRVKEEKRRKQRC